MAKSVTPIRPVVAPGRSYSFFQDTSLPFPELYLSIFVAGSPYEQKQFAELFVRAECYKAPTIEQADIVVFSGGPDVNPALYGATQHVTTRFSAERDAADIELYYKCVQAGIPMVGICRGAQFLHVMNGGKLFQDVDNHNGDHPLWDVVNQAIVQKVSSVHHQLVMENTDGGMQVLAHVKGRSTKRIIDQRQVETGVGDDIEAFFYRETCCYGVQGHPEYRGYYEFQHWFLKMLEHVIVNNPDVSYGMKEQPDAGLLRVKKELLSARIATWKEEVN